MTCFLSFRDLLIPLLFLLYFPVSAQVNFRADFEKSDPAPAASGLSTEERLVIHQEWLKDAKKNGDTLQQIFGEIYLFYDHSRLQDLSRAATHILKAESLAEASGNSAWRGAVAFRRGHLYAYLREPAQRIAVCKDAVAWCTRGGDSLCVAESLEALSASYGFMDSFDLAHHYFDLALPMIKKFGEQKHLQTTLANYGNLLIGEGKPEKAIVYQEEAKEIAAEIGNDVSLGKAINNLANAYRMAGYTDRAIAGFEEAIAHNKKIGNYRSVVRNYAGLRQSYQAIGDYKSAIAYQELYYNLQDSLIGSQTKIRIAELEAQYLESEQALALEKSEQALLISRQRLERGGVLLAILLLAALLGVLWWQLQNKRYRAKIRENRKTLEVVTRLLIEKNEAIMRFKEKTEIGGPAKSSGEKTKQVSAIPDPDDEQYLSLFDQSILTNNDWSIFKATFDKSFPGYVKRIRDSFPAITESEERLFLLLKLKMTSKEISNMLGISVSSVKKTRNRLRKKLPLQPEDGLEEFVQSFPKRIGVQGVRAPTDA